jgi:hypothetical protein
MNNRGIPFDFDPPAPQSDEYTVTLPAAPAKVVKWPLTPAEILTHKVMLRKLHKIAAAARAEAALNKDDTLKYRVALALLLQTEQAIRDIQ